MSMGLHAYVALELVVLIQSREMELLLSSDMDKRI
jgi:hypothetical protein